jgi:Cu2+-exporting ATPase
VEATLDSPNATLGTAWIDGESEARAFSRGARVPSGGINLNRTEISLRAMQPWSESLLGQLLRPAQRDIHRDASLERIIRGYLIGIFFVATAAGLGWWLAQHDAARAWAVVTAVLVVSCPCAIGLAFPLADEIATLTLRRRGVFIRENDLWSRLGKVRKVIFDKTGTLTLEHPVLQQAELLSTLTLEARNVLLTLVRDHPHPVCQSLFGTLLMIPSVSLSTPVAGELSEEIGLGIMLQTDASRWSLGRPGWRGGRGDAGDSSDSTAAEGSDAEFARDGVVLACFCFSDSVRSGAREEIAALQNQGLATYILSGDRKEKVAAMATALGIAAENAVAGATPMQKAAWVRAIDRRDTLMLGDGANDSLAFDAALVRGTPVIHRGVLESKADFYYLGQNLSAIRLLFEADEQRRRIQRRLLFFSVAYNLIAVGLAAAGRMNPLIAAVLMPLSSLATLGIVIGGGRPGNAASSTVLAPAQSIVRDGV